MEVDQATRLERKPLQKNDENEDEDVHEELKCAVTLWRSSKFKLIGFISWLAVVVIVTEVTLSFNGNRDRIYAEGVPLPYEKINREDNNDF